MLKNLQLLVCKQFRVANRFFFSCLSHRGCYPWWVWHFQTLSDRGKKRLRPQATLKSILSIAYPFRAGSSSGIKYFKWRSLQTETVGNHLHQSMPSAVKSHSMQHVAVQAVGHTYPCTPGVGRKDTEGSGCQNLLMLCIGGVQIIKFPSHSPVALVCNMHPRLGFLEALSSYFFHSKSAK